MILETDAGGHFTKALTLNSPCEKVIADFGGLLRGGNKGNRKLARRVK
jgi:hypothetical protein